MTTTPASAVVGDPVKDGTYAFTAKLDIGDSNRSCSGALVDHQWLITASSCFASSPDKDFTVAAGAPKLKTKATIGRTDLSGQGGQVMDVVELVPRADRDLVMAKLAKPVANVTPLALGYTTPSKGETLQVTGYGRTKDQWVPNRLHTAAFNVDSIEDTSIGITGKAPDGASICKGDTGGPAFWKKNGRYELLAVNSRSWQDGCLGSSEETRRGAVNTRVDDINPWIQQVLARPQEQLTASADFNGDGKDDVVMLHNYGKSKDGRNEAGLWVLEGVGNGFKGPRTVWETGSDSWNWNASKLVAGDFDGDGKADVAVLYDYGRAGDGKGNMTGLWVFSGTGNGFKAPRKVWDSGSDSWNWNASKLVSGDFDGDGKADVAVLYDYGRTSDNKRNKTGLWVFSGTSYGFESPRKVWDSGNDSWNWNNSTPVAGDFNGDGKADIAVLYNYGQSGDGRSQSAMWFAASGDGFEAPRKVWDSGSDSWNWNASKLVSGDFDGDGKADVAVLYDYGRTSDNKRNKTGLWVFSGTTGGFKAPRKVWDSGNDSWNWNNSQLAAGDFNGDGKADLAISYDYGVGADGRRTTALWTFTSAGEQFAAPRKFWNNDL
ncbi:FG-GAP-like repeat-containing protein [Streptomyces noursei]|uniref:FG-GAP-like repeat-containing protein n=1 Tax=Streptomyces noursei TaxID=1971 RepID=UPI0030F04DA9